MKTHIIVILVLLFTACKGQEKEPLTNQVEKDSVIEPKGSWNVNKEYDELGNLIKYDSVYSYSYTNVKGDSLNVNLDSIMGSFRKYFKESAPFEWKDDFLFSPENDSLFMSDFFRDDYFFNQWERQPIEIEELMQKMDSTRNAFLKRFHPGLMESKKKD
ncbi:hypothetical protein [Maribacter arcticus]|mgnify:CR=1 FL=1|uniref:hypothetical protein n=1 Tax=Maribacter arcticus TaxID=561365 RepID=UPI003002DDF4|tara:strand:+ start:41 stop:517 length:477 start_codon:yes stop_codon:yes gene_type:complete